LRGHKTEVKHFSAWLTLLAQSEHRLGPNTPGRNSVSTYLELSSLLLSPPKCK